MIFIFFKFILKEGTHLITTQRVGFIDQNYSFTQKKIKLITFDNTRTNDFEGKLNHTVNVVSIEFLRLKKIK